MTRLSSEAVTFDAGNTLLYCEPSPAEIYASALSRHGRAVEADEVGPVFARVWADAQARTPAGTDRYRSAPGGERAWWGAFVKEVVRRLEHEGPWEVLLDELYATFQRPEIWRLYPEVEEVVGELEVMGLRLAVISNWDSRLPAILDALGLTERFDTVTVSALEGLEKPAPGIFKRTVARLGVTAGAVTHVGDSPEEDYRGAANAGLRPILVDRAGLFADTAMVRIASLHGLVELVQGVERGMSAPRTAACSTR